MQLFFRHRLDMRQLMVARTCSWRSKRLWCCRVLLRGLRLGVPQEVATPSALPRGAAQVPLAGETSLSNSPAASTPRAMPPMSQRTPCASHVLGPSATCDESRSADISGAARRTTASPAWTPPDSGVREEHAGRASSATSSLARRSRAGPSLLRHSVSASAFAAVRQPSAERPGLGGGGGATGDTRQPHRTGGTAEEAVHTERPPRPPVGGVAAALAAPAAAVRPETVARDVVSDFFVTPVVHLHGGHIGGVVAELSAGHL